MNNPRDGFNIGEIKCYNLNDYDPTELGDPPYDSPWPGSFEKVKSDLLENLDIAAILPLYYNGETLVTVEAEGDTLVGYTYTTWPVVRDHCLLPDAPAGRTARSRFFELRDKQLEMILRQELAAYNRYLKRKLIPDEIVERLIHRIKQMDPRTIGLIGYNSLNTASCGGEHPTAKRLNLSHEYHKDEDGVQVLWRIDFHVEVSDVAYITIWKITGQTRGCEVAECEVGCGLRSNEECHPVYELKASRMCEADWAIPTALGMLGYEEPEPERLSLSQIGMLGAVAYGVKSMVPKEFEQRNVANEIVHALNRRGIIVNNLVDKAIEFTYKELKNAR